MTEQAWKRTERGVAANIGGERTPINGRGEQADVKHSKFAVEVKDRKDIPEWLLHAMKQAESAAYVAGKGQIPVVMLHLPGTQIASSLVVLKLRHFRELVKD